MLIDGRVRQAVIMAGGRGIRLQSLTNNCPKPMLPILDKLCIGYSIDSLVSAGIENVIIACGYKSEYIESVLPTDPDIEIIYSREDRPLGTGGAIKLVENMLDSTFIAVNGDSFSDINFVKQVEEHFKSGASVTISLSTADDPCEFGIVELDDHRNIKKFKEKPKPGEVFSNFFNTGVYVIQKNILKHIPQNTTCDFSGEVISALIERGCVVHGYVDSGYWIDIGRPENYLRANMMAAEKNYGERDWSSWTKKSVVTGKSYIGKNSEVDSCILESAIVLNHCRIKNSIVKDSMMLDGCVLDGSTIENSILGKECILKNGCRISGSVLSDGTILEEGVVLRDYGRDVLEMSRE